MQVIKRDGNYTKFNKLKIVDAILKAMPHGDGIDVDIAYQIANEIEACEEDTITVTSIENKVYELLIKFGQTDTAKKYETYRAKREFARQTNSTDEEILTLVNGTNADALEENSNKKADTAATQRDLIAGEVSKDIFRRKIMPTHLLQAHDEGILHWHDADYSIQDIHNCGLVDLEDMLQNGTVINDKLVEKAHSFATACTIATQIMAQVASSQYGGQSIALKHLAPFVGRSAERYYEVLKNVISNEMELTAAVDELVKKEIHAGIQTIRYQLSTLQTTNGQSPFCTIYLEIDKEYGYEEEQAWLVEEMLSQRIGGMKNLKGQEIAEAFPKLVYLIDDHNCLEGGEYDYLTELAAECMAKRMVPDLQSAKILRKNYEGGTFPPMG